MKSYNHLYEKFLTEENLKNAVWNATQNKCGKKKNLRRKKYYRENFDDIKDSLLNYANNFKHYKHNEVLIYDGVRRKQRTIIVPSTKELIVQHMTVNILKPIFMKSMYEHSYGSIPKRGTFLGKKRVEKWIRSDYQGTRWFLKMDVRKYFESIPHDILKEKLRKIIRDEKFLNLLYEIIDTTETGIPLGFYTSQWFANFYLTELDHYIKNELGAKHYIRYMDDMIVFDSNKKKLHIIRKKIENFLNAKLGLEMKGNWQICPLQYTSKDGKIHGRDLDFMGFRFFRNKTILRRTIMYRITRKVKRISKKIKAKVGVTIHDARAILSYLGWIKHTNVYNMYKKYIKPFVSIKRMKNIMKRNHDKEMIKCMIGNSQATVLT